MTAPMTEAELSDIMAVDALCDKEARIVLSNPNPGMVQNVKGLFSLANEVPRLVAEVRRLRKCQQEDWCPGVPVACQKHFDQLGIDVFQVNVERDKLRKMLSDSNGREEALIAVGRGFEDSLKASRKIGEEDRDRILKLLAVAEAARKLLPEFKRSYPKVVCQDELLAALEALDLKPVPMCQLEVKEGFFDEKGRLRVDIDPSKDPLEDLFPATEGGSPT